jgi:dipeptidyl-peptidase-3
VQLYADGFAELPLKEKTLLWHLYQAAIAGRDIFYDQRYAHSLDMRDVLEAIVSHKSAVAPSTFAKIERYAKLFWVNSGPYNNLTAQVDDLHAGELAAAAEAARKLARRFH